MIRVLVAGATGRLGRPVALYLKRAGFEVRAIARQPEQGHDLRQNGIEVARADVSELHGLEQLCRGCDAVYVSLRGRNDAASYERSEVVGLANLLAAARAAGVGRIVYLSGAGRSNGNERHFPARIKNACERLLRSGGVPYTVFRATHFMESLPMFIRGNAAEIIGRQPHRYHYVAVADYARMVVRSLEESAAVDQTFTVFGPRPWTMREALEMYIERVRPGTPIRRLPLPLLRLVARFTANRELAFATELFAAFAAIGEDGDPGPANRLLGAPQTTLEQWCAQQR
jgi:uncharacterized protein YbjT (DUF2867 family)